MDNLFRELLKRKKSLLILLSQINSYIDKAPDGTIRASKCKNTFQYYLCTDKIRKELRGGKYIRAKDIDIAREITQKEYCLELKKMVEDRLNKLDEYLSVESNDGLVNVIDLFSEGKKKLITTLIKSNEEYQAEWESEDYKGKFFEEGSPEIYSERGERVRSKSEKIIADLLYKRGIPYKYERPFVLERGSVHSEVIYPDFTILDIHNRKEIILEHFGKMDDPDYARKNSNRLSNYEKCGYFLGANLIVSHETSDRPLDTRALERYLARYLPDYFEKN